METPKPTPQEEVQALWNTLQDEQKQSLAKDLFPAIEIAVIPLIDDVLLEAGLTPEEVASLDEINRQKIANAVQEHIVTDVLGEEIKFIAQAFLNEKE